MPNWANLMLTKQGKVLQAKAIAGSTLTITKMKLGSGIIPDGVSPEDLTDLIQPKQALGLTAISVNGGLAKIQSIVTNAELSEGYYIRECGVFANDPDVGEIMYAIMTDTSPDFLPSASSSVVISEEFSINVVTENMANITAIIDPEGIVTVANARKIAEDKVTEHNEDTEAHPNDFNLKGITIGKDSVIATKKGDLLTLLAGKGINLLSDIKNKIITIVGKSKNAWNPNEEIIAGDIRYTEDGNGPSWAYLLCKTAGTTSSVEPILEANAVVGQEINDGSVVWTVQKNSNALSLGGNLPEVFAKLDSPTFTGVPKAPTAAAGTNTDQIASCAFVAQNSIPAGTIIAVSYTGVPEGYMHCNGAEVRRTTYVNLFNKIGTTYGAGDGSTTFNLPNTVARFLEGGVGAGTYYEAGLPNITGYFPADTRDMAQGNYGGVFRQTYLNAQANGENGNSKTYKYTLDASKASNVYGASETVQPPAITVIYCIKY